MTQAQEKAAQLKKAEEDKRKGVEMRLAAMEGMSSELTCLVCLHLIIVPC